MFLNNGHASVDLDHSLFEDSDREDVDFLYQ